MQLASLVSTLSPDAGAIVLPALGAFVTGLTGSPHCALMCGPLACVGGGEGAARKKTAAAWQGGRMIAYVLAGAGLGFAGRSGAGWLGGPVPRVLPWLMAAGLVLSALEGVGRPQWLRRRRDGATVSRAALSAPRPRAAMRARIQRGVLRASESFSPTARAALRGAITPLLPCGLIYGAFLAALGAGTSLSGALLMAAFALGTLPALVLVQSQLPRLGRARPRLVPVLRRVVPLVAAAVVIWRAVSVSPAGVPHCH